MNRFTHVAVAIFAMLSLTALMSGWSASALAQDEATPAAAMSMGAAYLDITNAGAAVDRLIAGKTEVAETVEIHEVVDKDGLMTMQPLANGLEIPAGATVKLEPGGYHIMLIGLTESLEEGMVYDLTLTFETAGDVVVSVPVKAGVDAVAATPVVPVTVGEITIANQWSRPAPKMDSGMGMGHDSMSTAMAGAFLTIANSGTEDDTLVSLSASVAGAVEVHEMKEGTDGVMTMSPLPEPLVIPAGGSVTLEPGALHLMLIGITEDLNEGGSYELTLTFEKAGDVTLTVPVTATAPDVTANPVTVGSLTISGAWTRPAPAMMGAGAGTPMEAEGTPEAGM